MLGARQGGGGRLGRPPGRVGTSRQSIACAAPEFSHLLRGRTCTIQALGVLCARAEAVSAGRWLRVRTPGPRRRPPARLRSHCRQVIRGSWSLRRAGLDGIQVAPAKGLWQSHTRHWKWEVKSHCRRQGLAAKRRAPRGGPRSPPSPAFQSPRPDTDLSRRFLPAFRWLCLGSCPKARVFLFVWFGLVTTQILGFVPRFLAFDVHPAPQPALHVRPGVPSDHRSASFGLSCEAQPLRATLRTAATTTCHRSPCCQDAPTVLHTRRRNQCACTHVNHVSAPATSPDISYPTCPLTVTLSHLPLSVCVPVTLPTR